MFLAFILSLWLAFRLSMCLRLRRGTRRFRMRLSARPLVITALIPRLDLGGTLSLRLECRCFAIEERVGVVVGVGFRVSLGGGGVLAWTCWLRLFRIGVHCGKLRRFHGCRVCA